MFGRGGDRHQHSAWCEYASELGGVARGEDVEQHVGAPVRQRQRAPDVGRNGGDPVEASGALQRVLGDVEGDADRLGQGIEHAGEVMPRAGSDLDDEPAFHS